MSDITFGAWIDGTWYSAEQLQRLKAENEQLKIKLHNLRCPFFFKHTAICLGRKDEMSKFEKCTFYANCNVKKMAQDINEYKQALEEIRKYCNECNLKADDTACEILAIIDEVLK